VDAGLASEKQHHQRGEKHHVAGQAEEYEKTNAVKTFARTAMLTLPVVVASPASASGGSPVNGGLSANSWFFAFNFSRGAREGDGHWGLCACRREITPTLGWTHAES
jgi:hypothetical protein